MMELSHTQPSLLMITQELRMKHTTKKNSARNNVRVQTLWSFEHHYELEMLFLLSAYLQ